MTEKTYEGIVHPAKGIDRISRQSHDRWSAALLTGTLELFYETPAGQAVSPGTGDLELRDDKVVASAARRGTQPVLPGTGIKGAVRTIYELLSPSCAGGQCRTKDNQPLCPACRLFGALGYAGRVGFSDAAPAAANSVHSRVEWVPVPFEPHGEKTPGDVRVYPPERFEGKPGETQEEMAREMYEGRFTGSLRFTNAMPEEMARLLICLGLGLGKAPRFQLRLGGARYDGWGGVRVDLGSMTLASSALGRERLAADEASKRVEQWAQDALLTSWWSTFGTTLERLAEISGLEVAS